ncbi:right-handed parallel beta-helix repeat-containing protein [uncultured Psychrobacter sp.]|uniref:right-handed parallel beta-helix repeat-containing protein n=1 Tax=uncultured Psychrobacter sp. TaxID=259303 RepID=UPI00345AFD7D
MKKISLLIMSSVIMHIAFSSVSATAGIKFDSSTQLKMPSDWTGNKNLRVMPYKNQSVDVPILDLRYPHNEGYRNEDSVDVQTVNQKIASLGDNGIVLISGNVVFDDSLIIGENQTLLGNGSLQIKTKSGNIITYIRKVPAMITNSSNSSVIKVASNTNISGVTIKGGLEGISSLNTSTNNITTSNVSISDVDISATTGDGIRLDHTDGLSISNSAIHDLSICEDKTICEFSVLSPTIAPNAAISAIGSSNIIIDNVDIDSVTYGIFLANNFLKGNYDSDTNTYKNTTSNVTINNTKISNSRREGLLLVGNDGVTTNNLTIDNSHQVQDMDLVVLQASHDVTMNDTNLLGGVNGLMIVNSATLPNFDGNDISAADMTISDPSRSGVFINPAATISLENVTVNNPGIAGLSLLGNEFGNEGLGAAVENMTLTNVQVNHPAKAAITFSGPMKNINGDVTTTQTEIACVNPSHLRQLEQDPDSILTINGKVLADLDDCD